MKKIVISVIAILGILILSFIFQKKDQPITLYPEKTISHGHGFAVGVADSNKLYIATHYGLLIFVNEKDLYRVGAKKDDYMGFSTHPIDPNILLSSGHPASGGNIGVQKSEDGGFTWRKISNGVNGPVDFHTMAVSWANPNIMYGWYGNALQRSLDGGENWESVDTSLKYVLTLITDPKDENILYAATMNGLMISNDKGNTWSYLGSLQKGPVTALSVNPQDTKKQLSFSITLGLAKSMDGGKSWEQLSENFGDDIMLFFATDKQRPEIVYALTKSNFIYKSENYGESWKKIL